MKWKNMESGPSGALAGLRRLPPHELLGVHPQATPEELKQAYRQKVMAYHPDRAGDFMRKHNGRVVQLINAAYRQLKSRMESPL